MYADRTKVPVDRSQSELKKMLQAAGAQAFAQAEDATRVMVIFEMRGRRIKLLLPLPTVEQIKGPERRAQEERRRWRALVLVVKAKIEAVASGVRTFEQEWCADTLMANGLTLHEWIDPQIVEMYKTTKMPPMLPGIGESKAGGP